MCRGEKKAIVAKVSLTSAVTCLMWPPSQQSFVFGQADGKVGCICWCKVILVYLTPMLVSRCVWLVQKAANLRSSTPQTPMSSLWHQSMFCCSTSVRVLQNHS